MKRMAFLLLLAPMALQAATVNYEKENGDLELNISQAGIKFSMSSVVDQSRCEISGSADPIDNHRAAYTPSSPSDLCVIVFDIEAQKTKVTTKDCNSYCGLGAEGSMDGVYTR